MRVWEKRTTFFRYLPYSSLHSFLCDLSLCFDAGWPSLTFLSLLYSSISLYLIRFLSFLILLDVWLGFSFHTLLLLIQYVHSFIITFSVGILRFATHDGFLTHCISCMRGMGIISLGLLSLVSVHFFHPITLAYVTSRVLRPPWDHDFTHYVRKLTHEQYSRLVGDYFLEHEGWEVGVIDYTEAYPSYQ